MGLDANGDIVTRRISICRHTELAQVRGLKMIVSMFLEFADVVVPVAQSALNNAKQFSSWLLVTLIGRSLGLVYRGIKESMNGGNGNANNAGNNATALRVRAIARRRHILFLRRGGARPIINETSFLFHRVASRSSATATRLRGGTRDGVEAISRPRRRRRSWRRPCPRPPS